MRRSGQPSRPNARTCCCVSLPKMLGRGVNPAESECTDYRGRTIMYLAAENRNFRGANFDGAQFRYLNSMARADLTQPERRRRLSRSEPVQSRSGARRASTNPPAGRRGTANVPTTGAWSLPNLRAEGGHFRGANFDGAKLLYLTLMARADFTGASLRDIVGDSLDLRGANAQGPTCPMRPSHGVWGFLGVLPGSRALRRQDHPAVQSGGSPRPRDGGSRSAIADQDREADAAGDPDLVSPAAPAGSLRKIGGAEGS